MKFIEFTELSGNKILIAANLIQAVEDKGEYGCIVHTTISSEILKEYFAVTNSFESLSFLFKEI